MYFIHEYEDRETLMQSLALQITTELQKILIKKKTVTLAVPGGATPKQLFQVLSLMDIEWGRITVILTDERFVPEKNGLSNSALLKNYFLKNFAAKARLINFYRPNYSVSNLARVISDDLKTVLPIDVCILGMGTDMHTASIFPNSDRLSDALDLDSKHILVPINAPGLIETRLTLTARVLRQSSRLHILITGPEKKMALDVALETSNGAEVAPIRAVLFRKLDINIHYAD